MLREEIVGMVLVVPGSSTTGAATAICGLTATGRCADGTDALFGVSRTCANCQPPSGGPATLAETLSAWLPPRSAREAARLDGHVQASRA